MSFFVESEMPTCRVCGCWDYTPCWDDEWGGCWWVDDDLCSLCASVAAAEHAETMRARDWLRLHEIDCRDAMLLGCDDGGDRADRSPAPGGAHLPRRHSARAGRRLQEGCMTFAYDLAPPRVAALWQIAGIDPAGRTPWSRTVAALDTMRTRGWLRQPDISLRGGRLSRDRPNRKRGTSSALQCDEPPAFNPAARVRWRKDLRGLR